MAADGVLGSTGSGIAKRRLIFVAKLAVTAFAFVAVASLADVGEALRLMRDQSLGLLFAAGLAVFVQVVLGAMRWRAVLKAAVPQAAAQISPAEALRLYYASIFFNAFVPGGSIGGDVMRVVATRGLGVTTGAAVNSVVLDRMLTLAVLLFLALPAAPLVWQSLGISSTAVILLAGAGALSVLAWQAAGMVERLQPLRRRASAMARNFGAAALLLARRPGAVLLAVLLAAGAHVMCCLAMWLIARSVGVELGLGQALLLVPLVFLASALPISVGGWGVREIGAIGLLGLAGVASHEAVVVSLQFGVISTLVSLPGGLIWLSRSARRPAPAALD